MVEPTITSDDPKGKLPIDVKVAPSEAGVVNITKALANEEATPKAKEAQEAPKTEDKKDVVEAPTEKPKPEKVETKTFSQEEIDKQLTILKGGYDGTVTKLKADIKVLTDDVETRKRQAEEQALNDWIKSIEDDGGDVGVARKIVEREKAVKATEQAQADLKAQLDDLATKLSAAGKVKAADDLIKTHGLTEDVREKLLEAEDLTQMEITALKLRVEAKEAGTKPPETVGNAVRASTKGMDMSNKTISERLGILADEYDKTGEMV